MKILRLTRMMWTQTDGTRIPMTTVTWETDDGVTKLSTFEGHLSPDEALYKIQVEAI